MTQSKTYPRVLRTRKLIMGSFIDLSGKKEFKDITIKDITTEAMINRATFYYRFEDICIKSINASLEGLMVSFLLRIY
jgi:AcrR family transcriptional regulator